MTQVSTTPSVQPIVGTWDGDVTHSSVEFVTRYLMTTKVRGKFAEWQATLTTAERPQDSKVEVTIPVTSLTTGNEQRDGHLRSADFFEVDTYPTITFVSTGIGELDGQNFEVTGDLTMHGVTKPVTLRAEWLGNAKDPWGNTRTTFSASTEINREDWGLTWNAALETGGVLVSKKVTIEVEAQFVFRKDADESTTQS